jgi:hypothetical protein
VAIWKKRGDRDVAISLSLFIRSDIFSAVSSLAREPDKLPVRRIRWPDDASLLDVVEQRYVASQQATPPAGELTFARTSAASRWPTGCSKPALADD